MTTPMIHQDDIQRLLRAVRKLIQNNLEADSMQRRSCQKKAFADRGLDNSIHIEVLKATLHGSHRLHTGQREASPLHRQPPKATFILAKDAPRALSRWWQQGLALGTFRLQEACQILLKGRDTCRVFL
jgi:hypothetical protein